MSFSRRAYPSSTSCFFEMDCWYWLVRAKKGESMAKLNRSRGRSKLPPPGTRMAYVMIKMAMVLLNSAT